MTKRVAIRQNLRASVSVRVINVLGYFGWMNKDAVAEATGCCKAAAWKLLNEMAEARIVVRRKPESGTTIDYNLLSANIELPPPWPSSSKPRIRRKKPTKELSATPSNEPLYEHHQGARELGFALGGLGYRPQSYFVPSHREVQHVVTE